jgi:hypothetical protein
MSSPLAIGAVSAVLRNLLDDGLIEVAASLGSVKVTAVAPDTIKLDDPDAPPSMNLFLYRVTPNQGWRTSALPSVAPDGRRVASPPLALDLHYLLTAYGHSDFQAEIMLGYGMHLLHERPVLDRAAIRRALSPSPFGPSILPPAFQAVSAADLADQLEAVTVTIEPTDTEEMSRLWSALQAHYRPTAAYLVSVVLIEATTPTRSALPVLSRGPVDPTTGRDRGPTVEPTLLPPLPTVAAVTAPAGRPAARAGDTMRVQGHHLDGTALVAHLAHPLLDDPHALIVGSNDDATGFDVTLPAGAAFDADWPAGFWTLTVDLVRPGEATTRTSNTAALLLAPTPGLGSATLTRDAGSGAVDVTLPVRPHVRPSQRARLALGADVAIAAAHPTTTGTLSFSFGPIPAGQQWVRLEVDGVESLLVDPTTTPPAFDPSQRVVVPA